MATTETPAEGINRAEASRPVKLILARVACALLAAPALFGAAPAGAAGAAGAGQEAGEPIAPVPLYRDPLHDGAADPSIVFDPAAGEWVMFYTNRRADLPLEEESDVSWVHGTAIGTARSRDGAHWSYAGEAAIPSECTGPTLWAPEVARFEGRWHMWLSVVPGIVRDWDAPRRIVHLTSDDLETWTCGETLELGSDRVIDADVIRLADGSYRMFFNDERQDKAIRVADSDNLGDWTPAGTVVETPGEGPVAFFWKGSYWLISDAWKGLLVMRSPDAVHWTKQDEHLLAMPGTRPTDRALGRHPDVVVAGDRAFLFYFVQQDGEAEAAADPAWGRRSVVQVAELVERDGRLVVDRDAPARIDLGSALGQDGSGGR